MDTSVVGRKDDSGKLRWDLLPIDLVEKVVAVLTHGGKKYGDYNWQKVADPKNRYYAAAMRHLTSWRKNELVDSESGIEHLAHAICCLIFLMEFDKSTSIPKNVLQAAEQVKLLLKSPLNVRAIVTEKTHGVVERHPRVPVQGAVALADSRKYPAIFKVSHSKDKKKSRPRKGQRF